MIGPLDTGRDAFVYIFMPALITLIPLASDRLAALIIAAALMLLFVFLEILTVGVYYLPAAGAMSAAALVASSELSKRRRREVDEILERFTAWAGTRGDVRAVALVGSWSRGNPRADSDVDLVLLTWRPELYVEQTDWITELGDFELVDTAHWGKVTERRLETKTGLEIDVGVAETDWRPIEDTRALYDPDALLSRSSGAEGSSRT